MHPVPKEFARTIREVFQERGATWLEQLPLLLEQCAQRWALTLLPPFRLSYNYVAPGLAADGSEVVLKLGVPNKELLTEIDALQLYHGRGSVRLLACDRELGVLLLERLRPGTLLASLADDAQRTTVAGQVMQQLWRPAPPQHSFPTLADWATGLARLRQRFAGSSGPLPAGLLTKAERLFEELLASTSEPAVLHGDLHHENILSAQREPWLAIDPKGVVGDPAFEIAQLLFNQLPDDRASSATRQIIARRVDQLAEQLALDRERVLGWALAKAVLSAWWSIEDHGYGWEPAISCAEHLQALLR